MSYAQLTSDAPVLPVTNCLDGAATVDQIQPHANTLSTRPVAERLNAATRAILNTALAAKDVAPADRIYLVQLIAGRTGVTPAEAGRRVSDVFAAARQAVDTAR